MRASSRSALLACVLVLSLMVAACGGGGGGAPASAAGPPSIDAAKTQAAKFRTLGMPDDWINFGVFYTELCSQYELGCTGSGTGPNRFDTDMSSAEEIASFLGETADPAVCADIGIAFGQVAEAQGAVLPYLPAAAAKLPAAYRAADGGWVATAVGVISILVNTDRVPNPPRSWADLAKPEYKGLISISNPVTSGTGQAMVFSAAAALGNGKIDLDKAMTYFGQLQDSGQFNEAEYSNAAFERGETPISLRYDFVGLQAVRDATAKGVNAQVIVPSDGGVFSPSATMCNAKTLSPDLAKLVLDFSLTDRGQLVFAEVGARPVRYVLGDLEVPADKRTNWLPDEQYAKVVNYPDAKWPDPAVVADRWEGEVLA